MEADDELLTTKPGRAHVYTNPSWQAVRKQSSRKMSAVNRSWAIFLHISGSNTGQSSKRGQAGVPINFIGSYDETIRPQGANPPEPIAPPPAPEPLLFVSDDLIALERTAVRGGVRIERYHRHPRPVALSARHHALLVERKYCHEIVLAAHHDVLAVRAPAHAEKATEVGARNAHQLHVLVVEDA
uniref:Uncharacterized protein n=1 Tax=Anopheles culicifacies TaxID=139723 RepID=A0A182M5Z3_9DIPT